MEQTPRRFTGRLLLVANLAAATLACATCAIVFLRPALVGSAVGELAGALAGRDRIVVLDLGTGAAWCVFLAAVLLLLCNFAWLVRRAPAPSPRTYVVSETPTGTVRVAREALESGLRTAGEALPEITRLRIAVDCAQARRVLVRGFFQCAEGTSNLNASQRLRAALYDRFVEMVHVGEGVRADFELEFQGFAGKLDRKVADARSLEPEPPPFTGPKYPIDSDESGGS
jgi:hypothetical protein